MTEDEFADHILRSGLKPRELADLLHVSITTVERWVAGKNCPHGAVRNLVVAALPTALDRIVKELERSEESGGGDLIAQESDETRRD